MSAGFDALWRWTGAGSPMGPLLCALGVAALAGAALVHGVWRRPTVFDRDAPESWARVSVHLLVYGVWAVGFGAAVWAGPAAGAFDPRMGWERGLRPWPAAEPVYASVYLAPLAMPWLARGLRELRDYCVDLWLLLAISLAVFAIVPAASVPPEYRAGDGVLSRWLAAELGRGDFAAASLPSFHVFWALLCARLLAARGRAWAWGAHAWAAAVTAACVLTGAHAVADVAASWAIWGALGAARGLRRRRGGGSATSRR